MKIIVDENTKVVCPICNKTETHKFLSAGVCQTKYNQLKKTRNEKLEKGLFWIVLFIVVTSIASLLLFNIFVTPVLFSFVENQLLLETLDHVSLAVFTGLVLWGCVIILSFVLKPRERDFELHYPQYSEMQKRLKEVNFKDLRQIVSLEYK